MKDARIWFRSVRDESKPRLVAEFRVSIKLSCGLIVCLNAGTVERSPDPKRPYWVVYPHDEKMQPVWAFWRHSRDWFSGWVLQMFLAALDDPQWDTGEWFRVGWNG